MGATWSPRCRERWPRSAPRWEDPRRSRPLRRPSRSPPPGVDVLVIDSFERLNLLDGWIRNELTRALPAGVTTLLVGRRGPNAAWRTAPGWRTLLGELVVGPLTAEDVDRLLAAHGIRGDDAVRIRTFARGHPLAVVVAGEALARRPGLPLGSGAPPEVVEELFAVMLDDLGPRERAVADEAAWRAERHHRGPSPSTPSSALPMISWVNASVPG
jgi:hypothetical protein